MAKELGTDQGNRYTLITMIVRGELGFFKFLLLKLTCI
jgi:hypothetical protein